MMIKKKLQIYFSLEFNFLAIVVRTIRKYNYIFLILDVSKF